MVSELAGVISSSRCCTGMEGNYCVKGWELRTMCVHMPTEHIYYLYAKLVQLANCVSFCLFVLCIIWLFYSILNK